MKSFAWLLLFMLSCSVTYAQTKTKKTTAKTKSPTKLPSASVHSSALQQKWVHSYEDEKGDGIEVYRSAGYSFPLARGRKAIKFGKDGMLVRFDIAPNDGQKIVIGKWEPTKLHNIMKVVVQGAESSVYFLEIVSVGKGILKVKRKSEI